MARHPLTLFSPATRAELRQRGVTSLRIVLAVCLCLPLTAGASPVTRLHFEPVEISRPRGESERPRPASLAFEETLRQNQTLATGPADPLGFVARIDNLCEASAGGMGGGMPLAEAGAAEVAAIERATYRTGELAGSLDGIQPKLERLRWSPSTPSIAPVKGLLTSGFGYRSDPMTHGPGIHQGIDIAAAPGQPVHASAEGIVVRAGEVTGLGLAVYVAHAYGLSTRYGHMSRIDVRPGQHVQRGDVVGLVGNTGRSTGYHLHYEVRVDGEPVNPLGYIPDDASGAF